MKIEKLDLSNNITVYSYKYDWAISRDRIIDKVYKNYTLEGLNGNTSNIILRCNEFQKIHNIAYEICKSLTEINDEDYLDDNFIYIQDKKPIHRRIKGFHNHTSSLSKKQQIENDWTYCFYLQLPKNIVENEGKLTFEDKNNSKVHYSPSEGEILIFKADINHIPEPTPNAECDRITIVGVFAFNINIKLNNTYKSIL